MAARHLPGLLRRVLLPYKHALALVDDAQLLAVVHAARPSQSDTSPTEITSYQPSTFAFPFPRAYPSAASSVQTSIPRPLTCCSPHLAAHLVSNISLPSAALTAARFRHPPRSSVEPQPHVSVASVDSHIACIPALPSGALQSCPRVLDMNIIRTHAARSDLPWFQRVIPVVVYSGHLIYARRAFDRDVHVESSS